MVENTDPLTITDTPSLSSTIINLRDNKGKFSWVLQLFLIENLTISRDICCNFQDNGGRDLKSAQNTPSRQPLAPPQQTKMAPPPLQDNRTQLMAGQDFSKKVEHNSWLHVLSSNSHQVSGISNEIFRQIETVENRYDQSTAEAFRTVQKSGEMVVRRLDSRQFIRLASETANKINVNTNVRSQMKYWREFSFSICRSLTPPPALLRLLRGQARLWVSTSGRGMVWTEEMESLYRG